MYTFVIIDDIGKLIIFLITKVSKHHFTTYYSYALQTSVKCISIKSISLKIVDIVDLITSKTSSSNTCNCIGANKL